MSTNNDFTKFDPATSTARDAHLYNSDVETFSSNEEDFAAVPKDYWFGKKYFECVLAQDLLIRTPVQENILMIDAKLETATRLYPYGQKLKFLQAQGVAIPVPGALAEHHSTYEALITLIGTVIRNGTSKEKRLLITTLRGSQDKDINQTQESEMLKEGDEPGFPRTRARDSQDDLMVPNIAQYSMALKERGDKIGISPKYSAQTISLNPPKHKVIVGFQNYVFEGTAETKKQAKHQAAKEACDFLGLEIS